MRTRTKRVPSSSISQRPKRARRLRVSDPSPGDTARRSQARFTSGHPAAHPHQRACPSPSSTRAPRHKPDMVETRWQTRRRSSDWHCRYLERRGEIRPKVKRSYMATTAAPPAQRRISSIHLASYAARRRPAATIISSLTRTCARAIEQAAPVRSLASLFEQQRSAYARPPRRRPEFRASAIFLKCERPIACGLGASEWPRASPGYLYRERNSRRRLLFDCLLTECAPADEGTRKNRILCRIRSASTLRRTARRPAGRANVHRTDAPIAVNCLAPISQPVSIPGQTLSAAALCQ
jgi:hypothetical protein